MCPAFLPQASRRRRTRPCRYSARHSWWPISRLFKLDVDPGTGLPSLARRQRGHLSPLCWSAMAMSVTRRSWREAALLGPGIQDVSPGLEGRLRRRTFAVRGVIPMILHLQGPSLDEGLCRLRDVGTFFQNPEELRRRVFPLGAQGIEVMVMSPPFRQFTRTRCRSQEETPGLPRDSGGPGDFDTALARQRSKPTPTPNSERSR